MLGDSIVARAGSEQQQIQGGGRTYWSGVSGARCAGLMNRISRLLQRRAFPTTLILHVGSNDILKSSNREIRSRVLENIRGLRALLPNTRIIWSDILVRLAYCDERVPGAGRRAMRNINKYAHVVCRSLVSGDNHVNTLI